MKSQNIRIDIATHFTDLKVLQCHTVLLFSISHACTRKFSSINFKLFAHNIVLLLSIFKNKTEEQNFTKILHGIPTNSHLKHVQRIGKLKVSNLNFVSSHRWYISTTPHFILQWFHFKQMGKVTNSKAIYTLFKPMGKNGIKFRLDIWVRYIQVWLITEKLVQIILPTDIVICPSRATMYT